MAAPKETLSIFQEGKGIVRPPYPPASESARREHRFTPPSTEALNVLAAGQAVALVLSVLSMVHPFLTIMYGGLFALTQLAILQNKRRNGSN